jgi:NAD(P)-dependent dehydrogenase (short-subunit alcohol dehydrogenase family)
MSSSVLVSGANGGLGRGIIRALSPDHTVIAGVRNLDRRDESIAPMLTRDGAHVVIRLDVLDDDQVDAAVAALPEPIAAIVHAAGSGLSGPIEAISPDQLLAQIDLHAGGALRLARAALPRLRRQRSGVLVNISSGLAILPVPASGGYAAAKAALETLTAALRYELAPHGVDAVIVQPGAFATGFRSVPAEDAGHLASVYPEPADEPRAAAATQDPDDVGRAVAALLATPPGQRPLRTIVGADMEPARAHNEEAERLARALLGRVVSEAVSDAGQT